MANVQNRTALLSAAAAGARHIKSAALQPWFTERAIAWLAAQADCLVCVRGQTPRFIFAVPARQRLDEIATWINEQDEAVLRTAYADLFEIERKALSRDAIRSLHWPSVSATRGRVWRHLTADEASPLDAFFPGYVRSGTPLLGLRTPAGRTLAIVAMTVSSEGLVAPSLSAVPGVSFASLLPDLAALARTGIFSARDQERAGLIDGQPITQLPHRRHGREFFVWSKGVLTQFSMVDTRGFLAEDVAKLSRDGTALVLTYRAALLSPQHIRVAANLLRQVLAGGNLESIQGEFNGTSTFPLALDRKGRVRAWPERIRKTHRFGDAKIMILDDGAVLVAPTFRDRLVCDIGVLRKKVFLSTHGLSDLPEEITTRPARLLSILDPKGVHAANIGLRPSDERHRLVTGIPSCADPNQVTFGIGAVWDGKRWREGSAFISAPDVVKGYRTCFARTPGFAGLTIFDEKDGGPEIGTITLTNMKGRTSKLRVEGDFNGNIGVFEAAFEWLTAQWKGRWTLEPTEETPAFVRAVLMLRDVSRHDLEESGFVLQVGNDLLGYRDAGTCLWAARLDGADSVQRDINMFVPYQRRREVGRHLVQALEELGLRYRGDAGLPSWLDGYTLVNGFLIAEPKARAA